MWLKPTDFKNDEILVMTYAKGGLSLAAPSEYQEADLATDLVDIAGVGGFTPVELEKLLAGRIPGVLPYISAYTHGMTGSASPKDLEIAFQLLYLHFTAPNRTPESFELMRTRLRAALANRAQNPEAAFGERLADINTMGHYTAKALRPEDVPKLRADVMQKFYEARFANAADFTFFVAGTFSIDQITPLITQ